MSLEEFIAKQSMPKVSPFPGAYLISFKHPSAIADAVAGFSLEASAIVPAVTYDAPSVHTAISAYMPGNTFSADWQILGTLACIVHKVAPQIGDVTIDYDGWRLESDRGIATGTPNSAFHDAVRKIASSATRRGIALPLSTGADIEVNRFPDSSQGDFEALATHYASGTPLGLSRPISIDVGHYLLGDDGFEYKTYHQFPLSR